MKEAKSGKNADRAAAASSSDASAAVGLQRVISQTERCDIRPTTEESQGCRRSTRKRNREAGEETQPSAPSTEGSSKATNKRRKNSNGK
ncbi:hypothetical protein OE88DRAFT_1659578 [Heliocybe sulcata]|uniref:Uncharacterized protein n=1 Tax=Heliocybe sulcata TaxID=5364 RepID=A0A5C3N386_9AGAM|nr:hypothetical protein OE88DRAFT_1659578 [Heliocybe sulcata]